MHAIGQLLKFGSPAIHKHRVDENYYNNDRVFSTFSMILSLWAALIWWTLCIITSLLALGMVLFAHSVIPGLVIVGLFCLVAGAAGLYGGKKAALDVMYSALKLVGILMAIEYLVWYFYL